MEKWDITAIRKSTCKRRLSAPWGTAQKDATVDVRPIDPTALPCPDILGKLQTPSFCFTVACQFLKTDVASVATSRSSIFWRCRDLQLSDNTRDRSPRPDSQSKLLKALSCQKIGFSFSHLKTELLRRRAEVPRRGWLQGYPAVDQNTKVRRDLGFVSAEQNRSTDVIERRKQVGARPCKIRRHINKSSAHSRVIKGIGDIQELPSSELVNLQIARIRDSNCCDKTSVWFAK
ncbi:hypothetical protein N183_17480 [Sinorhizobium sp. Sb3]|nr:hypothetical protein N183_17480 [Sinorhizobium sp. Sb3]